MSEEAVSTLGFADIMKVMSCLPHRYPFLMVDKIKDIDGVESAIGIKNVTFNEPHFLGHFPGNPIMPGVLIIEGMAQTAGTICVINGGMPEAQVVYFMTIDKCKFRKPVVPGDQLEYHVKLIKRRGNIWKFQGTGIVDGAKVAEAEISAMIVGESE